MGVVISHQQLHELILNASCFQSDHHMKATLSIVQNDMAAIRLREIPYDGQAEA
jgi:hypothetical protein